MNDKDKDLLLVNRDFTGNINFENRDKYNKSLLIQNSFDGPSADNISKDDNGNGYYHLMPNQEFALTIERKFKELTSKDHVYLIASFDARFHDKPKGQLPVFVMTMEHNKWSYAYCTKEIKPDTAFNKWTKFEMLYLTPEIRNVNDVFKCYVWKRSNDSFDIDNFKIETYEHK